MKYIKVRYRLTNPGSEPFDVYGWDTLWNKKTQILGSAPVEPGDIVNFQSVTVRADGRCLILATKRNIKAIKAMMHKNQMTLAPGEVLDIEDAVSKRPEDAWPEAPRAAGDEGDLEPGEVDEEALVKAPRKRRKASDENLKPDLE